MTFWRRVGYQTLGLMILFSIIGLGFLAYLSINM